VPNLFRENGISYLLFNTIYGEMVERVKPGFKGAGRRRLEANHSGKDGRL